MSILREVRSARSKLERTARRVRATDPRRAYGLDFAEVTLRTADDIELRAWYVERAGAQGGVVVHHHVGGQKATALPWIELLHAQGLAVLAIDARAHAASGGQGRAFTFAQRRFDVRAGVDWLHQRCGSVYVLGQSQGAAVAVMAAAGDARVRGVICDSGPAADVFTASWGLVGTLIPRSPWVARATATAYLASFAQPLRYTAQLGYSLAQLRDRPLLWVHGDRDRVIPRGASAVWFDWLRAPRWRATIVAGAGHVTCVSHDRTAVARAVEEFLTLDAPRA